jgi:hypothetical protein
MNYRRNCATRVRTKASCIETLRRLCAKKRELQAQIVALREMLEQPTEHKTDRGRMPSSPGPRRLQ